MHCQYLILTLYSRSCYDAGMTKKKTPYELTSVSFRLSPEQVRQLALLAYVHGGQVRALAVAIDRLFRDTLRDNAAFAELVASGLEPSSENEE